MYACARSHVCHTHVHALYTSMYMYVGICVYVILVCVTHLCHTHILHAGEIVIAKCACVCVPLIHPPAASLYWRCASLSLYVCYVSCVHYGVCVTSLCTSGCSLLPVSRSTGSTEEVGLSAEVAPGRVDAAIQALDQLQQPYLPPPPSSAVSDCVRVRAGRACGAGGAVAWRQRRASMACARNQVV